MSYGSSVMGKLYAKLLKPFPKDRRTLRRGFHMVHWIKGKLYAKNPGPDSRDKKVICLSRQTVIHCDL